MICGKCGREFAEGVKFCTNCGAELWENAATEERKPVADDLVEDNFGNIIETNAEEMSGETAKVQESTEIAVAEEETEKLSGEVVTDEENGKKSKEKKRKALSEKNSFPKGVCGLALAAVVAVILIVVVLVSGKEEFTTLSDKSVLEFYKEYEQMYAYLYSGEKLVLDDVEVNVEGESMDKTTVCYSNENGELVVLKDGESIKTGIEDAKGVKVSSEGDSFVYFTDCENTSYFNSVFGFNHTNEIGTLHLYFIKKGKDVKIAEDVVVSSAVLSPDGETVAYVADYEATEDFKGYYSVKGKKPVEIGKEKRVFAIADKGKYVYYTDDDRIYVQKNKDAAEKLAKDLYSTSVLMNADCTEMLFLDEDATYISVKGSERKKVFGEELNSVIIRNDTGIADDIIRSDKGTVLVTYTGADTFKNKLFYSTTRKDIVFVTENFETERLASDARLYGVADDRQSLVYVDGPDIVKVTDFVNGGVKTDLKEDAEARDLYVAGDLKYVYYMNSEKELYCIKGNGKAKKIADDVTSATVSADGKYCYYVVDDEKLCYSKKGKKGKALLKEENIKISCRDDYGVSTVLITREDTVTEYRMNGKEMEQFRIHKKSTEDILKEKYNLLEPLDSLLN